MSADSGPGNREVAYRVFAAEFEDSTISHSESDEERAPNYVITPTGARANRLFVVGVLTEVEQVNEDMLRGRVVDPDADVHGVMARGRWHIRGGEQVVRGTFE